MAEPPSSTPGQHYLPHQIVWRVAASGLSVPTIEPILTPPILQGRLTIHILKAKHLHNVSRFGHMDPFVEIKIGDNRCKTNIAKRGHVSPQWSGPSSKLDFMLTGQESLIRLRVFHKTMLGHDVVGTARLPLDFLLLHHGRCADGSSLPSPFNCANSTLNSTWIEIGRDSKQGTPAGSVMISVHFELLNQQPLLTSCSLTLTDKPEDRCTIIPDAIVAATPTLAPITLGGLAATPSAAASSAASRDGLLIPPKQNKQRSSSVISVPSLPPPTPQASSSASNTPRGSLGSLPGLPLRPQLFGGSLANGMARSKSSVPVVVFICISYLTHHGLKCVGLFRVSSEAGAQERLRAAFESGASIEVSDPHVTGDVLKSYFRQLSDPLIPSAMYQQFLNATDLRHEETSLPLLRGLLQKLPNDNYNVLSYLLSFLALVSTHHEVNKMPAKSLAMVFSPNLLRKSKEMIASGPPETAQSLAAEFQKGEDCLRLMIENYSRLFPEGPPTPFALMHPTKERPTVGTLRVHPGTARALAIDGFLPNPLADARMLKPSAPNAD